MLYVELCTCSTRSSELLQVGTRALATGRSKTTGFPFHQRAGSRCSQITCLQHKTRSLQW